MLLVLVLLRAACCCCFCLLMDPGGRPGPRLTGAPALGGAPVVGAELGALVSSFSDLRLTAAEMKTEN